MSSANKKLNLTYVKKGRLKQGDIFALLINDTYLFGRIVNDQVSMLGSHVALVYVYNIRSKSPNIDSTRLTPDKLLLPPFIPSPSLWTKGYAVKTDFIPVQDDNLLKRHCFKVNEDKYVDEFGSTITKQDSEYCNSWGIMGVGIIDDLISDAMRIKRAPLQEDDVWYMSGRGEKIWLKQPLSELKKYANYEEIIKKYPEIIEG